MTYYAPVPMAAAGYPMAAPMAMPQQHTMMAAPMMMPHQLQASTPYYGFAPMAQPQVVIPPPKVTLNHKERQFTLDNVNESLLKLNMDGLHHSVMRNPANPGQLTVKYFPKGDVHRVSASYNGKELRDLSFTLKPRAVEVVHHPEKKMFIIKNVHNPDKLGVNSRTLKYQLSQDKNEPTTWFATYQPENGVHDVSIEHNGKVVPNGTFRLAPRVPPQQQQMMVPQHQMMVPQMMHPHMLMAAPAGPQAMVPAGQMVPMAPMQVQSVMPPNQQPQLMMPAAGQPMMMAPAAQMQQQQQQNANGTVAAAAPQAQAAFQPMPMMANGPPIFMTPISDYN